MTAFPKYPAYKDSGVEWIGDVPEHWDVCAIRGLLAERTETNEGKKTEFILSVMKDRGVIPYTEKGNVGNKMSEDISSYKIVHPGDLVINKMNAIIGSLGISEYHGALSKVYFVMTPRYGHINNRFYGYVFQVRSFQRSLAKISYGIMELRESINFNEFKNLPLQLPPRAEQDRIVAFLDDKTAQIDALIAKKQRQIELLDEQKAILINRAVTRGLHPNPDLQDSGIPWIGPIPKHWELKRVKHCSLYFTSGSRGWGDYYADSGDAFLQSGDLTDNCTISLDNVKRVKLPRRTEGLRTRLESHDTVVCITGANTGRVANVGEVQETIFVNQHLCLVRPSKSINPQYLSLALSGSAGRTHFTLSQYGLKEGLNLDDVKNCLFPLPPIGEQAEILAYIQGLSKSIETTIAKVESQIQTLQTLRSTLIAHAVTGKIKV